MYWDYKDDNNDDVLDLFLYDWLPAIIITIATTCICMHFEQHTIICAQRNCYLHEHSFFCYLAWCYVNTGVVMMIIQLLEGITGMAVVYNFFKLCLIILKSPFSIVKWLYTKILIYNAEKEKYKASVLSDYEKFIKKR